MPLVRWMSKQEFDELYQKTEHELLELCQDIKNTTGDEFAVEVQEVVSRIGNWFNRETKVDHRYTVLFWAGQGEVQVINLMSGFFGGNSKEEVGAFLIGILCQKRVLGNSFPDHLSEMYSEVELSLRRENGNLTDELAAAKSDLEKDNTIIANFGRQIRDTEDKLSATQSELVSAKTKLEHAEEFRDEVLNNIGNASTAEDVLKHLAELRIKIYDHNKRAERAEHSNKVLLEAISEGNYKFAKAAIASWPEWKKKSAGIDPAEDLTCSCQALKGCKAQLAAMANEIEWTQKELGCTPAMCETCAFTRLCHMDAKNSPKKEEIKEIDYCKGNHDCANCRELCVYRWLW